MQQQQIIVLELVKEWLEKNDISILAAEKIAVNWTSLDGNVANLGWNKQSLADVVNILRGTVVSLELMKYMNTDVLLAAAQESDRMFERGVTVHGKCLPQFFNYASKRNLSAEESIVMHVIEACLEMKTNVLGESLRNVINKACLLASINPLTAVSRNRVINSFKEEMNFNYRLGKNRLHLHPEGKLTKYTCLQIRGCQDTPLKFDEKTEDELAMNAMNQALIG